MKKILVVNGPNLNMLGIREPGIYGTESYETLVQRIMKKSGEMGMETECFQSNHEGAIIDKIQESYGKIQGIVINPGAFTHYSYAIADCLAAVKIPTVEVHISDVDNREDFRKISVIKHLCVATVKGEGIAGYEHALEILNGKI